MLYMLSLSAQNVGINNDGSKPDPHAMLDIKSSDKGLLIPRMNSKQRTQIPNTRGLLVYDSTDDHFWYNTGAQWLAIPNAADPASVADSAWLITGNSNIVDPTNFLGTLNPAPINFRINNQPAGRIDSPSFVTFLGYGAGKSNLTSSPFGVSANTAIGYQALNNNTIGVDNTAVGASSLFSNTSSYGTAVGALALYSNTSGSSNTAMGYFTMIFNTTGSANTATGYQAMYTGGTGNANTATGYRAMSNNSGESNSAFGYLALSDDNGGYWNTAIGSNTLLNNTNGAQNVALGVNALKHNVGGNNNTALGEGADVASPNLGNATAVGSGAIVDASNMVRIGNAIVTVIEGTVPFTTPSDGRFKFNVREDVKGLDFILKLRPITYQFDAHRFDRFGGLAPAAYEEASSIRRTGFIAQEVESAADACGYNFSGIVKPKTEDGHYSLSYEAFVVPLVKAVQEQQALIRQQDARLARLEQELEDLKKLYHETH